MVGLTGGTGIICGEANPWLVSEELSDCVILVFQTSSLVPQIAFM